MRLLLFIFTTSVFVSHSVLRLEKDTHTQRKHKHIIHIEQKLSTDNFPTGSYHHVFTHFNIALEAEKQENKSSIHLKNEKVL